MFGHHRRCPGGPGSSSISDGDRSNKQRGSRHADDEAVPGAAAVAAAAGEGGEETVVRDERQKRKRPKNEVGVAIRNEGGAAAIATNGSRGAGAGAAPAWHAEDVIDVSEDAGCGEHDDYGIGTFGRLAVVKRATGSEGGLLASIVVRTTFRSPTRTGQL